MQPEPHRVAARLGFDEATIGRLAARGHLRRLALTEPQIRARLYRGHVAYDLQSSQTAIAGASRRAFSVAAGRSPSAV
jgi:hypothetical protein